MTCTLLRADVAAVLEREHAEAGRLRHEHNRIAAPSEPSADFRTSTKHRTQYLSIGPRMGRFLYNTARSTGAQRIVEFGTSFGISTIYLAAAAADTGGRVTGSEFHQHKAEKARANLTDAGLGDRAEIRVGDARETLAELDGPIDLLFLDGASDLYLDMLTLLEDRLTPGAWVISDNADHLAADTGFLAHVGDGSRYLTALLGTRKGLISQSLVIA